VSDEIRLTQDGERVLREAQNFCGRANVAIVAAEHLLAGALAVLSEAGNRAIPGRDTVESALMLSQGTADAHGNQVMFGSAARDAMNAIAGNVRAAGGSTIDALTIALGTIDSGEVNPMFYSSLGVAKADLRVALSA
jgi:hypothetical protein